MCFYICSRLNPCPSTKPVSDIWCGSWNLWLGLENLQKYVLIQDDHHGNCETNGCVLKLLFFFWGLCLKNKGTLVYFPSLCIEEMTLRWVMLKILSPFGCCDIWFSSRIILLFFVPLFGEDSWECREGQGLPSPVGIIFHMQKVLGAQEQELKVQ